MFVDVVVVDLLVGQRKLLIDYAVHVKSVTLIKKSDIVQFFEITECFVRASANGSLREDNFTK